MESKPNTDKPTIGVIICDHGSRRAQSSDSLKIRPDDLPFVFALEYQIVEHAHMQLAMPDITTAYSTCVNQGSGI